MNEISRSSERVCVCVCVSAQANQNVSSDGAEWFALAVVLATPNEV